MNHASKQLVGRTNRSPDVPTLKLSLQQTPHQNWSRISWQSYRIDHGPPVLLSPSHCDHRNSARPILLWLLLSNVAHAGIIIPFLCSAEDRVWDSQEMVQVERDSLGVFLLPSQLRAFLLLQLPYSTPALSIHASPTMTVIPLIPCYSVFHGP